MQNAEIRKCIQRNRDVFMILRYIKFRYLSRLSIFVNYALPVRFWSTWSSLVSWYTLAVVCAGDPFVSHVQASEVLFFFVCCPWSVAQLWPPHLLSFLSKRCPVCSCHLWCTASTCSLFLIVIVAINGHTSALYMRVDRICFVQPGSVHRTKIVVNRNQRGQHSSI